MYLTLRKSLCFDLKIRGPSRQMLAPKSFAARIPDARLVVPAAVNPSPVMAKVPKVGVAEKTTTVAIIKNFVFILKQLNDMSKRIDLKPYIS